MAVYWQYYCSHSGAPWRGPSTDSTGGSSRSCRPTRASPTRSSRSASASRPRRAGGGCGGSRRPASSPATRRCCGRRRSACRSSPTRWSRSRTTIPSRCAQFDQLVKERPEVLECHSMSGANDYLLRIVAASMEAYEHFLSTQLLQLARRALSQYQLRAAHQEVHHPAAPRLSASAGTRSSLVSAPANQNAEAGRRISACATGARLRARRRGRACRQRGPCAGAQRLREPEERPAVLAGWRREILAVDGLGLRRTARDEQLRAEQVAHREEPVGGRLGRERDPRPRAASAQEPDRLGIVAARWRRCARRDRLGDSAITAPSGLAPAGKPAGIAIRRARRARREQPARLVQPAARGERDTAAVKVGGGGPRRARCGGPRARSARPTARSAPARRTAPRAPSRTVRTSVPAPRAVRRGAPARRRAPRPSPGHGRLVGALHGRCGRRLRGNPAREHERADERERRH